MKICQLNHYPALSLPVCLWRGVIACVKCWSLTTVGNTKKKKKDTNNCWKKLIFKHFSLSNLRSQIMVFPWFWIDYSHWYLTNSIVWKKKTIYKYTSPRHTHIFLTLTSSGSWYEMKVQQFSNSVQFKKGLYRHNCMDSKLYNAIYSL